MRGQVNRCVQPLPQIRFQKFICRISLIAGSPIIEGTERSGWQLDLTTALEDFQITNVHPTDGYGFADLMDVDFQLSQTGDVSGWIKKWRGCGPHRTRARYDAGKIRKIWLPARDSNSDNLLMLLGAHSDFGMSAFVAERQV